MSNTKPLRVGVIGCGGITQMVHLPYLHSMPELFEITAISDLSIGTLKTVGGRYGISESRQVTDYKDLLKFELDAVLVLHSGNHAPTVLDAIHAGKHVFVEKPLCFTLEEADTLIQAANASDVCLMVGYMKRYDPGYRYAQSQVQSMSDIRFVQINTLHPSERDYRGIYNIAQYSDIPPEILQPLIQSEEKQVISAVGDVSPTLRRLYTNVFLGSMSHDTNALRGLLGEPNAVLFTELWPDSGEEVSITTILAYSDNVRVVYTWTYLDELRDYFQEIAIMSSANRLRIQFPSPYLRHFPTPIVLQGMENGAAYVKRVEASHKEAFQEELIAFYDCIANGTQPITNAVDARADIALLQRIFAALRPRGLGGEAARH